MNSTAGLSKADALNVGSAAVPLEHLVLAANRFGRNMLTPTCLSPRSAVRLYRQNQRMSRRHWGQADLAASPANFEG